MMERSETMGGWEHFSDPREISFYDQNQSALNELIVNERMNCRRAMRPIFIAFKAFFNIPVHLEILEAS